MDNPLLQQAAFFGINFAIILATLLFYAIFLWVVASWFIMFGLIRPNNRAFAFLTQLVMPILKPFSWAKMGAIDLSPIMAILVLDLALNALRSGLGTLLG